MALKNEIHVYRGWGGGGVGSLSKDLSGLAEKFFKSGNVPYIGTFSLSKDLALIYIDWLKILSKEERFFILGLFHLTKLYKAGL